MNVGFIGAGRMAEALAKAFITSGLTKGSKIIASCAPDDELSITKFKEIGATINFNNGEIIKESEVTILAVKPNITPAVIKDIKDTVTEKNLLISVVMGISIHQLEKSLPKFTRIVRVMPNTPALVRKGASVFACGSHATENDSKLTKKLFESVGTCEQVPEYMIDPVTALSGSGPAYIFSVIEALSDGAVRMGMTRDLAYRLAAQTVIGAGHMVLDTNTHPGILKDNVSSPGGSTCEGLYELEKSGVRAAFISAIEEATKKCKEASKTIQLFQSRWE